MFGRLDLENPKKNGGDRVLEEFAQDRRYLQVNTRGESCDTFLRPEMNNLIITLLPVLIDILRFPCIAGAAMSTGR